MNTCCQVSAAAWGGGTCHSEPFAALKGKLRAESVLDTGRRTLRSAQSDTILTLQLPQTQGAYSPKPSGELREGGGRRKRLSRRPGIRPGGGGQMGAGRGLVGRGVVWAARPALSSSGAAGGGRAKQPRRRHPGLPDRRHA